jgi:benzoate/toluate 1,2-dioxygenase subunit beta
MSTPDSHSRWLAVTQFIGREMAALDDKDWDRWLALYDEDAEYWVPAWDDRERLTADPQSEISLIYYPNRGGLEDRVFRIRTGRSSASTPPARTAHLFTLISVDVAEDGVVRARTSWSVASVLEGLMTECRGSALYDLAPRGESFVIKRKKTIVVNDVAETMIDVYSI